MIFRDSIELVHRKLILSADILLVNRKSLKLFIFVMKDGGGILNFLDRISDFCEARKMTFAQFEREAGLSRSQISQWRNRGLTPNHSSQNKLAAYMGISITELMSEGESVPAYSLEPSGGTEGFEVSSGRSSYIPLLNLDDLNPEFTSDDYERAVIMTDKMEPVICRSDIAVILRQDHANHGDIVLISKSSDVDPEYCRLYNQNDGIILIPLDRDMSPVYYDASELRLNHIRITGVLKALVKHF